MNISCFRISIIQEQHSWLTFIKPCKMPTHKPSENFRNFLCSWGLFNISFAHRLHQLKFSRLLVIKCSNSGVPSPSSSQSLICVSLLHLLSPLLAILDYCPMSTHQKKMVLVNWISGVKLSTGALWEFASLESKTAPLCWQLPEKLQRFCISHPLIRSLSSLSLSLTYT